MQSSDYSDVLTYRSYRNDTMRATVVLEGMLYKLVKYEDMRCVDPDSLFISST
jgi:hypothetical protein